MDYSPPGEQDPDCLSGKGDITEVTAEVCRTSPYNDVWDIKDNIEAECLLPFRLNGETYDGCILDDIQVRTLKRSDKKKEFCPISFRTYTFKGLEKFFCQRCHKNV